MYELSKTTREINSPTVVSMEKSPTLSPESSPLSLADSESFEADYCLQELTESQPPPAKRQKVVGGSQRVTPATQDADFDALSFISSDTSGDVPQSPTGPRPDDEEPHEQVTVCSWEGCGAGDFGNMDRLVDHIHNSHIDARGKKYTCEWEDCSRKSMAHASAYALKAHVRSHTRQKPFYCTLPECDRSFTRSDALAKHMRTVHETEALRPSDPIPKSMQHYAKSGTRLKLVIKPNQDLEHQGYAPTVGSSFIEYKPSLDGENFATEELGFTPEELALGPKGLYRLLRRQMHWAEEESDSLRRESEMIEAIRKKEWLEKEILLHQVIKNEMDWHERRRMAIASLPTAEELKAQALAHIDATVSTEGHGIGGETTEERREDREGPTFPLARLHENLGD